MKNKNANKRDFLAAPVAGGKGAGLAYSGAVVLFIALQLIVSVVLAANGWTDSAALAKKDWYLYLSFLVSPVAFGLVALWYLKKAKTKPRVLLQSQNCSWKYYLIAILLQIGLFSLSQCNTWFIELLKKAGYQAPDVVLPSTEGFGLLGVLVAVAFLPAVTEEILFRGVLLKGLKGFSTAGAVLLCGGLFSLYHMNPAQTVYQFCCGVAFALLALRAGSVLPTMLAHFLNNTLIVLLYKFGVNEFSTPVLITVLAVSVPCLIAATGYLIFLDRKKTSGLEGEEGKFERKSFLLFAAVGIAACALLWVAALWG